MKTIIKLLKAFVAYCLITFNVSLSYSQIVVPRGWESKDSIRFGMWGWNNLTSTATPFTDSMGVNFQMGWGSDDPSTTPGGRRVGVSSLNYGNTPQTTGLTNVGALIKERIFYPSPDPLGIASVWRYNAIVADTAAHGAWNNNMYDANDISPYVEYPQNPSIVTESFSTLRFDTSNTGIPKTVRYGDEGRVILGYSDKRNANDLFTLMGDQLFSSFSDTAKATNAILEFNINRDTIDMDSASLGIGSVPLLRVQILFKAGTPTNQAVLPFVPFKTASQTGNRGWWKIIDTIVTRDIYDSLTDSYRTQDSVNGNTARSWKFKQLHLTLTPPPLMQMDSLFHLEKAGGNGRYYNLRTTYGGNTDNHPIVTTIQHPDSLVNQDTDLGTKNVPLLEIRILSTFRSTVRIRSLCYHDDIADKFLYRKRYSADSTHSLNANGSFGGLDDSIKVNVDRFANLVPSGVQREIEWVDYTDEWNYLSLPTVGIVDYLINKRNMHAHIHEQFPDWIEEFRRGRMSQNGIPPSMFENEAGAFSATKGSFNQPDTTIPPSAIFPLDYVYNGLPADNSHPWPLSANDSMVGQMFVGRLGTAKYNTSDSLYAYHRYTDLYAGFGGNNGNLTFLNYAYRLSSETALLHPRNKRFAIEASPQGWGLFYTLAYNTIADTGQPYPSNGWHFPKNGIYLHGQGFHGRDSVNEYTNTNQYFAYYEQRPTTPEETL